MNRLSNTIAGFELRRCDRLSALRSKPPTRILQERDSLWGRLCACGAVAKTSHRMRIAP